MFNVAKFGSIFHSGRVNGYDVFIMQSSDNRNKVLGYYYEYHLPLLKILEALNLSYDDFTIEDWADLKLKVPLR